MREFQNLNLSPDKRQQKLWRTQVQYMTADLYGKELCVAAEFYLNNIGMNNMK